MKRLYIATCPHEQDEYILADDEARARELLAAYLGQFGWPNSDDWQLTQQDYITDGE